MSELPLTIVTVTYNAEDSIDPTLRSIVGQTNKAFEWLIVDGNSRDATLQKIRAAAGQLVELRVISEPDKGLYDAMNKGVRHARGRYVIFMNAGDCLHDADVVGDFVAYLRHVSRPAAMIYGHTQVRFSDGQGFLRRTRPLDYIWHGQPTIHQSVFFNRLVHAEVPYEFDRYPVSSDYAVMATIQKNRKDEILLWDRIVSQFNNDPKSYSNKRLGMRIRDAWNAQRDILELNLAYRSASAFKRVISDIYYNRRSR